MVTLYRLAECYETIGRLASAWEAFTKVVSEAKRAGKPDHEQDARERAGKLRPRLPKLTIVVPASLAELPGLEIRRDDVIVDGQLWNHPAPVDPGQRSIVATAPNRKPWRGSIAIKEAEAKELSLPPHLDAVPLPGWKIGAGVAGGAGFAGFIVGVIWGSLAIVNRDKFLKSCGVTTKDDCKMDPGYSKAEPLFASAKNAAAISTVGFIVAGSAAAATGLMFWLNARLGSATPARTSWEITPAIGTNGAGVILGRRF